jgi:diguanylate cyclase (GGDEF)-like protein
MPDSSQTRAGRAVPVVALILAIAFLLVAVGAAAVDHGRKRDSLDRALKAEVRQQSQELDDYFDRARSLTQITANNPAYREFYVRPGERVEKILSGDRVVRDAQKGLAYLEKLFPGSIGEACFIDAGGGENARAVRGRVEGFKNLSPDETKAPFFEPTFSLKPGEVYQARPYLSPDTNEWVISNSSPIVLKGGEVPAIVHFEITIESFRQQAAETSDRFDIAIVEASTGEVIADSRFGQPPGAESRLGRPDDRRFARFFSTAGTAFGEGTAEIGGRPSAFKTLPSSEHNANEWVVVATAEPGSSLVGELGLGEIALTLVALLLLTFAVLSFRASQAQLRSAALTDPLTGLGNRRGLVADLEMRLPRASVERPLLLGLFDLDGFKAYNDAFGHPAGDALLVRLSTRLQEVARDRGATAYRMGGDEFCVLASVEAGSEAAALEAASTALSEHGEGFAVGASYGSTLLPVEGDDPAEALRVADQRMYAAKAGGRASVGRQTTDVLVRVLAERYPDLGEHLDDVTQLCHHVAQTLDLPDEERASLLQAASLHDIGKAAVPDAIVSKPGPLNEAEWTFMRQHTIIGERILATAPALAAAARLVRCSHERFDGTGYPDGLHGEEIPLGARVIAVADAFDAMTSSRPYRPTPMSAEGALAELRRCAGGQFDPAVVEAFARALQDDEARSPELTLPATDWNPPAQSVGRHLA